MYFLFNIYLIDIICRCYTLLFQKMLNKHTCVTFLRISELFFLILRSKIARSKNTSANFN